MYLKIFFFFVTCASFCFSSENTTDQFSVSFGDNESFQEVGIFKRIERDENDQDSCIVEGFADYVDGTKCKLWVFLTFKELGEYEKNHSFLHFSTRSEFEGHVKDVVFVKK